MMGMIPAVSIQYQWCLRLRAMYRRKQMLFRNCGFTFVLNLNTRKTGMCIIEIISVFLQVQDLTHLT